MIFRLKNNFNFTLGSVLLKQLYNLDLKLKENWPKKRRTFKICFFKNSYQSSFKYINSIQKGLNTLVH